MLGVAFATASMLLLGSQLLESLPATEVSHCGESRRVKNGWLVEVFFKNGGSATLDDGAVPNAPSCPAPGTRIEKRRGAIDYLVDGVPHRSKGDAFAIDQAIAACVLLVAGAALTALHRMRNSATAVRHHGRVALRVRQYLSD